MLEYYRTFPSATRFPSPPRCIIDDRDSPWRRVPGIVRCHHEVVTTIGGGVSANGLQIREVQESMADFSTCARLSRRRFVQSLAVAMPSLGVLAPGVALAQDDDDEGVYMLAEVPTFGAARPGPIRLMPETAAEVIEIEPGVAPVAIQIDTIGVDAPIETVKIVDGVMQDPSGPWIVSWYDELSALGEQTNVVMAGHVDYWNVGPAVFWGVKEPGLAEGDIIRLFAENDEIFEYAVNWSQNFVVATELTPEVIQKDIVGDTGEETLTLITCGGEFNAQTGEYLERMVVRATLI
jgi:sortase (surface protein transpeptidase)